MLNYLQSVEIEEVLCRFKQPAILLDANVDMDALASSLSIQWLLETLGIKGLILCANEIIDKYKVIPGVENIVVSSNFKELNYYPDLLIIPDLGSLSQLGQLYEDNQDVFWATPTFHIDHHLESSIVSEYSLIDKSAAATSEQIVLLCRDLKKTLPSNIGILLLAGIIADTRSFATPTVTSRTLSVCSSLVAEGADIVRAARIAKGHTINQLKLWGISLSDVDVVCDGQVGLITVTLEMLRKTNSDAQNIVGLVNLVDDANDTKATVLLRELPDGGVRVSLRSSKIIRVLEIATKFGGGGHPYAAACILSNMSINNAKQLILNEIEKLLNDASQKPSL